MELLVHLRACTTACTGNKEGGTMADRFYYQNDVQMREIQLKAWLVGCHILSNDGRLGPLMESALFLTSRVFPLFYFLVESKFDSMLTRDDSIAESSDGEGHIYPIVVSCYVHDNGPSHGIPVISVLMSIIALTENKA
ncbi:hypothetical protein EJB05_56991, partial [Eragrostis curvula]